MANKTLIPALKAKVGEWNYYICMMKYASVAREVSFAHELGGNSDLSTLIQRGITNRTRGIVDYLLKSSHRFLGAMIVAAWGGNPQYNPVKMEENEELLQGLDNQFGVLTFDGTQQYFALDGQHRLRAIKDALKKNPELGADEICVLLVSHYDTEEGRKNTRRLFTNINKNAKSTTKGENIALDEDDAFAIISRRLVDEHPFLSEEGRTLVFTKKGDEGELKLASENVPKTNKKALTTLSAIYNIIKELDFGLHHSVNGNSTRPADDILDEAYDVLKNRIDNLLLNCGDIENKLKNVENARELRAPNENEIEGHAFMRPVIQRSVARTIKTIVDQSLATWDELMQRLSQMSWKVSDPPWLTVTRIDGKKVKMISQRDHVQLLDDLLYSHLAPPSKQHIKRARKDYKEIKGSKYPVSEVDLCANLIPESTEED